MKVHRDIVTAVNGHCWSKSTIFVFLVADLVRLKTYLILNTSKIM